MSIIAVPRLSRLVSGLVDIVLPPRCLACGGMISAAGSFCADCFAQAHFLAGNGCVQCGHPMPDMAIREDLRCGGCMTDPPAFDHVAAVMAYDDIARSVALQIKHGQIGHAGAMARLMARRLPDISDAVLVPVPLHRWRLWKRGYNQSLLLARGIAHGHPVPVVADALERIRPTPSLGHLNRRQRKKIMAGAIRVKRPDTVAGRHIILVDDVFTTGATANACAQSLKQAGAARVDVLCWARVVR